MSMRTSLGLLNAPNAVISGSSGLITMSGENGKINKIYSYPSCDSAVRFFSVRDGMVRQAVA